MKFNINDYKGNYVMHCKTEEEAKDFVVYMASIAKPLNCSLGCYYGKNVCFFNEGAWGSREYAEREGYIVLEWSDFMNFTKADLKTGDVVKLRDGDVGIVNLELDMCILSESGWLDLSNYDSELINKNKLDCDIIAVRRPTVPCHCQFNAFKHNFGVLVYERKEVEEMTLAEVCRLLGKEIKIIQ